MNERIRELMIQADYPAPELALRAQKLVELIVQECAELALTFNNNIQSLNDKEIRSHSSRVSDYIKDRMGVE